MYKIDKTLINNMNLNRSCIVITPQETTAQDDLCDEAISVEDEEQISPVLREKTREFIQKANEKAQKLYRDAQIEAEQLKEAARKEGYEAGMAEGRQKIDAEFRAKTEEIRDALTRVEAYRQDLYHMLESDVLSLSIDVAEKIINTVMEKNDNVFKGIVKKAVESVKHADNLSLYISRADYERYFKEDDEWLREKVGSQQLEVVNDGNLAQGSCLIEADNEIVDAGISMQLNKVRQLLSEQV